MQEAPKNKHELTPQLTGFSFGKNNLNPELLMCFRDVLFG